LKEKGEKMFKRSPKIVIKGMGENILGNPRCSSKNIIIKKG